MKWIPQKRVVIFKYLLAAIWLLLGAWLIYCGLNILVEYPIERKGLKLFEMSLASSFIFSFQKIILGVLSLVLANIIFRNKENRLGYLVIFTGLVLCFNILNVIEINRGVTLLFLPLVFLIWAKNVQTCLLVFLTSLALLIVLCLLNNIIIFYGNGMIVYGLLIAVSCWEFEQDFSSLMKIKIGRYYRLMLLIGFIPTIIIEFIF